MTLSNSGDASECGPFWSVRMCARRLVRAATARELLDGAAGATCLMDAVDDDFRSLVAPGLAAVGIASVLIPLPAQAPALVKLLGERLRRGVCVPLLAFEVREATLTDTAGAGTATDDNNRLRSLRSEAAALALDGDAVRIALPGAEPGSARLDALQAGYTHLVRLTRGPALRRRGALRGALLRWAAFASAHPERLPAPDPASCQQAVAVSFLLAAAGARSHPVATRVRRSAAIYGRAGTPEELAEALHWLLAATLIDIRLAAAAQAALLDDERPMTGIERRELIYLARAGTKEMRTLAARRLCAERQHADVRATLEQLRADPEEWVRAAACSPLTDGKLSRRPSGEI